MTSAIAAYSGGVPVAQSSTQVVAFGTQADPSPSLNQSPAAEPDGNSARTALPAWTATSQAAPRHASDTWTPSASDDNGGDSADDDDDDPDDVPTAVAGSAPPTLGVDHRHTLLLATPEVARRAASVSDGHSLRGPPNARITMPAWTAQSLGPLRHSSNKLTAVAVSDGNSGDPFDDDDDDDSDDDVVGAVLAPAPSSLTADYGHSQLPTYLQIDRRPACASGGHSLRAPPQ